MRDDYDDNYNPILGNRVEKISFFYPLSQIRKLKPKLRKTVLVLGIIFIIGIGFILYSVIGNKIINEHSSAIIFLAIGVVLALLGPIAIIFAIFSECRFSVGIYDKGIEMQGNSYLYKDELKEIKIYQYFEDGNEYIRLISTEFDGKIKVKRFLYNQKMDKFLNKFQEIFQENGVVFEKISDLKGIDISAPIEYRTRFWFSNVWKLLSRKEKSHRIKNILKFVVVYLIFAAMFLFASILGGGDNDNISIDERLTGESILERFNFGITFISVLLVILIIFLTIHFILSVKKFYARIENNAVYIHNGYGGKGINSSDNYILSKIKANYGIIAEGNLEGIMLNIDDGDKTRIFKRPKNEEVERFCNDLLAEIRKRKTLN